MRNFIYCLVFLTMSMSCAVRQPRDGLEGLDGKDAQPCSVASVTGGIEISCPGQEPQTVLNGLDGAKGDKGDQGIAGDSIIGPQGLPGVQGIPGISAAAIPVALCEGATVYPSAFAEYGFCISNELYGVYWDSHNAWLAKIVPGHYSSTSTTVPCTLTVGPNCSVTH